MKRALDAYGRIDVAFANAGFGGPRGFDQGDVEEWKTMVLTNVYGAALTIRATMGPLKESKGHLLLTGSVAGRRALKGSLYSATKWAVTGMGEAARQDFNDSGVRVSLIEPGMTDTPFFDTPPEHRGAHARRHRPRGHVRRAAAAARRRQRDPDPADRAAELVGVGVRVGDVDRLPFAAHRGCGRPALLRGRGRVRPRSCGRGGRR